MIWPAQVGRTYDLPIASLAFVPKGEDAFCYVAETAAGEQYFVRAKPAERGPEAEEIYEAVAALRDRLGIRAVLAPLRSAHGRFCWEYRGHVVTVYRFVAGTTVYDSGAASVHVTKAARIMAILHRSDYSFLPPLPLERFDNPFEPAIREALTAVTAMRPHSGYEQRIANCLLREQSDLIETFDRMRRMQRAIVRLRFQPVVTHGDPNWANLLVGPEGTLLMTDWGELALGPRERDLMFFTGEHFDGVLAGLFGAERPDPASPASVRLLPVPLDHAGDCRLHDQDPAPGDDTQKRPNTPGSNCNPTCRFPTGRFGITFPPLWQRCTVSRATASRSSIAIYRPSPGRH